MAIIRQEDHDHFFGKPTPKPKRILDNSAHRDGSRPARRRALKSIAQKLIHPLYDYRGRYSIITAMEDLQA